MRAPIILTVLWTLLSAVLGIPWARRSSQQNIEYLDIATPERIAAATEFVNKRYQERTDRIARDLSNSNATHPNVNGNWYVKCGGDDDYPFDNKPFQIGLKMFKDWCDSPDGTVSPFSHYYLDFGDTRIAICNWGLWNPCNSAEVDDAMNRIDDECPLPESGDDDQLSTGLWYEPAWRKGYWRSNCTTQILCGHAESRPKCRNEG
ncbi:hypothetical protein PGQ11_001758 [Apiospora arundinis]|uniref:Uncharacterized protein n=1 Tax=Apiospora arundinis TaxID=335852 RepID=A0ABR2JGN6_9PEZI